MKRFGTHKWVFDAAALRLERKARAAIAGAYDFIERTAVLENGMDMDPDSFAAIQVLDRARRAVAAEFDLANATAKRAS